MPSFFIDRLLNATQSKIMKKTISVINVMKVIDVHHSQIEKETYEYLRDHHQTYTDQVSNEHLFQIDSSILDELPEVGDEDRPSDEVIAELTLFINAASANDAAYVRFIE